MRVDLRKVLVLMAAICLMSPLASSLAMAGAPPSGGIVLSDFNGDGFVDIGILNNDRSGGSTYTYFMQGTTILGAGPIPGSPTGGWQNSGYPAINASDAAGVSINDGLTEFAYTFDVVSNSAANIASATLHTYTSGQSNAGFADSDLIIDIGGGFLFKKAFNGLTLDAPNSGTLPGAPAGYTLGGYPDINGDGTPDVSVVSVSQIPGFQFVWTIGSCDGTNCAINPSGTGVYAGPPADYTLVGYPDLNGDGTSDTLIQRTSDGLLFAYLTGGASGTIATLPGMTTVAGVGDVTGEGRDDIVLDIGAGFLYLWAINPDGLTIDGSASGVLPGPPAGTYTFPGIQAASATSVN